MTLVQFALFAFASAVEVFGFTAYPPKELRSLAKALLAGIVPVVLVDGSLFFHPLLTKRQWRECEPGGVINGRKTTWRKSGKRLPRKP